MTEMTDVNIKLKASSSSSSLSSSLPSELEYSMPEGEISKDYSNNYNSIYFDEYRNLYKIFESNIEDNQEIKKLQEDIFMKHLDNVGTCDKSIKLLILSLIDFIPFGLFNSKSEMISLANVLGKSTWNYILNTTSTVLPLFITTVYNMFTPQDFQVKIFHYHHHHHHIYIISVSKLQSGFKWYYKCPSFIF